LNAIGIFGGTFDPIHIGHLRTCVELREYLQLEEMHMIPCARPAHREQPGISAIHRLAMLCRAIEGEPGLRADDRELRRKGLSYTVDTLQELRHEKGDDCPLYLCVGMDSLANLDSWQRWQELTAFAHLVVVARPGWQLPKTGPVANWLEDKLAADMPLLKQTPAGLVLIREMTLLPVSSTKLRQDLTAGHSVRYLVPDAALDYINQHHLYQKDVP